MTKDGLYELGDEGIVKGKKTILNAAQVEKLNKAILKGREFDKALKGTKDSITKGDGGEAFADAVASHHIVKATEKAKKAEKEAYEVGKSVSEIKKAGADVKALAKAEADDIKKTIKKNTEKVADKTERARKAYDAEATSDEKTARTRKVAADKVLREKEDEEDRKEKSDSKSVGSETGGSETVASIDEKSKTSEKDNPERNLDDQKKDDAQKKSDEEIQRTPIEKDEKTASDFMSRKRSLSDYLNSGHPNTAGLIFGNSGLTFGERLLKGLEVLGKVSGGALLANGMALLGDNSFFSKIGEGTDIESLVTDNQKEFAKKMNDATIETAKQITQNKDLLAKLYTQQGIKNIDPDKVDFLSYFATTVSALPEQEAIAELERNGFSADEAITAYKNAMIASKTTGSAQELIKGAMTTEMTSVDLFSKKFETKDQVNKAINELRKQRDELTKRLAEISKMSFDESINFASKNRDLFRGIASSSMNSSSTEGSNSSWSANGSVGAAIGPITLGVGGGGGHSWNSSSAQGFSNSMDYLAQMGIHSGEKAYKDWWKKNGSEVQSLMKAGVESAIKDIDRQIEDYTKDAKAMSDETLKDITPLITLEDEEERYWWKWLTDEDEFSFGGKDIEDLIESLS